MGAMADSEVGCHRKYRNSSKCGKLFFCFYSSSSSSSSSMKITRSIFSPARHKDHPFSLSSSLNRRLTSNGSLKGAQSPFPTSSKKRGGAALDNNPEPTSPKVTCIGQVRVKSKKKKQGRKLRTPSRRRSGAADESFRRMDNWGSGDLNSKQTSFTENRHRTQSQRWVHLPLTICEGLKGLGSSSCFSSSSKGERERERERESKREIEIEAKLDDVIHHVEKEEEEDEEEGRLSISVPPKNALLLMRCRSDPMRVAALSRRLLESPLPNSNVDHMNLEDEEKETRDLITPVHLTGGGEINLEKGNEHFEEEEENESVLMDEEIQETQKEEEYTQIDSTMAEEDTQIDSTMAEEEEEEEEEEKVSLSAASENEDSEKLIDEEEEEARESVSVRSEKESTKEKDEIETVKVKGTDERVIVGSSSSSSEEADDLDMKESTGAGDGDGVLLPDCLLLMMREPKVSMEVSKETWVCSTDFKRILPDRRRPANKTTTTTTLPDSEEDPKNNNNKRVDGALILSRPPKPAAAAAAVKQQQQQRQQAQPARSSCSLPGPISTAQKLPRCNSEPRTVAVKLIPSETCMWKSRKVEQQLLRQQQQSTTVGLSPPAGVGF